MNCWRSHARFTRLHTPFRRFADDGSFVTVFFESTTMRFLIFSIFLAFFPLQMSAEEGRVSLEGSLALGVDACSFRGSEGPYEEVVIRFPAMQLAFETQGDSLFVARYVPRLELFDENGNSVKRIEGERVFSSAERIGDPEHFVYDIARFQVPAGYYHAVLDVKAVGQ